MPTVCAVEKPCSSPCSSSGGWLSVGSIASLLSVGSIASIASVGSLGSVASVGSIGSVGAIASIGSVGGVGEFFGHPVAEELLVAALRRVRRE